MNTSEVRTRAELLPPPVELAAPQAADWTDEELIALLPASVKGREKDVVGFFRELPRLLAAGEEGRTAVIHDGDIVNLWDTFADAVQAAYQQFGVDGIFLTATVKATDLERLPRLLAQHRTNACPK
jgi:hypothetical protein